MRLEKAQLESEAREHQKFAARYQSQAAQWRLAANSIVLLQSEAELIDAAE
jgi:hypothetical protein